VDIELLETGTQGQKHPGIVADHRVRGTPLRNGLAADLHHAGEVLAIKAPGSEDGLTVAIEQEDAVEPVPIDPDQIPHVDTSDMVGSCSMPGTYVGIRWAVLRLCGGMRRSRATSCHTVVWPYR
jgi:hypothetical protein